VLPRSRLCPRTQRAGSWKACDPRSKRWAAQMAATSRNSDLRWGVIVEQSTAPATLETQRGRRRVSSQSEPETGRSQAAGNDPGNHPSHGMADARDPHCGLMTHALKLTAIFLPRVRRARHNAVPESEPRGRDREREDGAARADHVGAMNGGGHP